MNNSSYLIISIAVVAAVTLAERGLPFALFAKEGDLPRWVTYLGRVLPCVIMAVLVVYCLKGAVGLHGIFQLLCVGVTAILQWYKGSIALSISAGTVLYMLLIRIF